ncbi:chemotaxis protein CheD [Desulfocurvus sp. DL9XJH121]
MTFHYRPLGIGGMFHAQFPSAMGNSTRCLSRWAFVDEALQLMLSRFRALDIPQRRLEVKIFGGASRDNNAFSVAQRNIDTAFRVTREEKLVLVASSVGGSKGRKILFDTLSGKTSLSFL